MGTLITNPGYNERFWPHRPVRYKRVQLYIAKYYILNLSIRRKIYASSIGKKISLQQIETKLYSFSKVENQILLILSLIYLIINYFCLRSFDEKKDL
jgi:hypothetical protein